jgi:hypothetical protein
MTPYSLVRGYQLCVGSYCNRPCSWNFIPEGRGNTFLRSVGPHLTTARDNDIVYRDRVLTNAADVSTDNGYVPKQ